MRSLFYYISDALLVRFWWFCLAIILLVEASLYFAIDYDLLNFDRSVNVFIFSTIPLFILTILQFSRNLLMQRAAFIKDYVAQIFLDGNLYDTFHDLIYTYTDDIFEEIDGVAKMIDEKSHSTFEPFQNLQNERKIGRRYYHPKYFQGSLEEKRLDAFLGFLDVIGYYYNRNLIGIRDIYGTIGYILVILRNRKVISCYMEINESDWMERYRGKSPISPFSYLRHLLDDFGRYMHSHESELKAETRNRYRKWV